MKCLVCQHDNPGTVQFCQKCGKPLDYSAEEIRQALVAAEKEKKKRNTEYMFQMSSVFALALFLAGFTAFLLSGGPPPATYHVPSLTEAASYIVIDKKIRTVEDFMPDHFYLPP